jgi:hypothetical protein
VKLVVEKTFVENADVFSGKIGKVYWHSDSSDSAPLPHRHRASYEKFEELVHLGVAHHGRIALETGVLKKVHCAPNAIVVIGGSRLKELATVGAQREIAVRRAIVNEPE